ncbi:MAG: PLP-dependent aminotransferase family protein [Planctomycetota bacterium]|nr:MAG: PLP-dependent aminotransferase family protein [Planctomycetota bacterium]
MSSSLSDSGTPRSAASSMKPGKEDADQLLSQRARWAAGQPIGELMAQALKYPNLVSLAAGFVDNATLPCAEVAACFEALCAESSNLRKALQYDTTAGATGLREVLAEWSYRSFPDVRPAIERIVLTAGSNQMLHLLAEAIIDPGDIVLAAAPTYFVFMGTLKAAGAKVIGVAADEDGIDIDALEAELDRLARSGLAGRVKAVYLVPEFDNPAGSTLSLPRRQRLLEIIQRWRHQHGPLLVLSDNAYQLVRFEGEPLPPLSALDSAATDFVVELGTFSKSFSPGIRVGWGVLPEWLVRPILEIKANIDFGSPHLNQSLIRLALERGLVDSHLPSIIAGYRAKRDAMLDALAEHLGDVAGVTWRKPAGGLYVWLTLPEHIDASEQGRLWPAATGLGVLYVPGHYCFPPEGYPLQRNTIRLSYGVQSVEGIRQGVARLADAIRRLVSS